MCGDTQSASTGNGGFLHTRPAPKRARTSDCPAGRALRVSCPRDRDTRAEREAGAVLASRVVTSRAASKANRRLRGDCWLSLAAPGSSDVNELDPLAGRKGGFELDAHRGHQAERVFGRGVRRL